LDRDYRVQEYQFAFSNPQYAEYDENGNFTGLNETGAGLFHNFLNTSYYGPDGKISTQVASGQFGDLKGADQPDNPNNQAYTQALSESPALSVSIIGNNKLNGVPEEGSLVNVGGRLMQVTKGVYRDTKGRNDDRFELTDIGSGTKQVFSGFTTEAGDVPSAKRIGEWAAKIP
jgi:hypothetical protein